MRDFELYRARIVNIKMFEDILLVLYVPQVCEKKVSPCRALPGI